jgi:hypothetical protein
MFQQEPRERGGCTGVTGGESMKRSGSNRRREREEEWQ